MDFATAIMFLVVYYVRPQEWGSVFEGLRPAMLTMVLAVIAIFMRAKPFSWRSLTDTVVRPRRRPRMDA